MYDAIDEINRLDEVERVDPYMYVCKRKMHFFPCKSDGNALAELMENVLRLRQERRTNNQSSSIVLVDSVAICSSCKREYQVTNDVQRIGLST